MQRIEKGMNEWKVLFVVSLLFFSGILLGDKEMSREEKRRRYGRKPGSEYTNSLVGH